MHFEATQWSTQFLPAMTSCLHNTGLVTTHPLGCKQLFFSVHFMHNYMCTEVIHLGDLRTCVKCQHLLQPKQVQMRHIRIGWLNPNAFSINRLMMKIWFWSLKINWFQLLTKLNINAIYFKFYLRDRYLCLHLMIWSKPMWNNALFACSGNFSICFQFFLYNKDSAGWSTRKHVLNIFGGMS